MHPAGVLMNAGRIERSRGDFYFYEEGVTPAVVSVIEAVDAERRALGAALRPRLAAGRRGLPSRRLRPEGRPVGGHQRLEDADGAAGAGAIETRWLTEDLPYGLVTWASLAAQVGVPTPHMEALITLVSAVLSRDCRATGRTAADLGLAGLTPAEIAALMESGWED